MDIVSLGFLIVIVLLGGLSAFVADSLAWKIGKQRISLWNMRPKHFARLVVTIAGALIPLVTILFLASTSAGVRVWITRGRQAAAELPSVVDQRDRAQRELGQIQRTADDLRGQNESRKRDLARQTQALAKQESLLKKQAEQIAGQSQRVAGLGQKLAALTSTANLRQSQIASLTSANARVQSSLTRAKADLSAGRLQLKGLKGDLKIIRAETNAATNQKNVAIGEYTSINKRNLELTNTNAELGKSVAQLRGRIDELNGEIASLTSSRDEARAASDAARADLAALRVQVEGLQSAREQLQDELNLFKGDFAQTRTRPLTYRAGDELARYVVPAGASVAKARDLIEKTLRDARIAAETKGARATPPGSPLVMRAADLVERKIGGRTVGPVEQIDLLAARLAGAKVDEVIIASAALNFFEGEAVGLGLGAFPDPIVFRAGEVIAEGRLDSRRGDEAVYAQINEFLGAVVQNRAREANMIPVRREGEATFGEVSPGQILAAIRLAGADARVYRLQAIAAGDIRAGDRLKVELRLK